MKKKINPKIKGMNKARNSKGISMNGTNEYDKTKTNECKYSYFICLPSLFVDLKKVTRFVAVTPISIRMTDEDDYEKESDEPRQKS